MLQHTPMKMLQPTPKPYIDIIVENFIDDIASKQNELVHFQAQSLVQHVTPNHTTLIQYFLPRKETKQIRKIYF